MRPLGSEAAGTPVALSSRRPADIVTLAEIDADWTAESGATVVFICARPAELVTAVEPANCADVDANVTVAPGIGWPEPPVTVAVVMNDVPA